MSAEIMLDDFLGRWLVLTIAEAVQRLRLKTMY
jgi:hypothetical protein